MRNTWKGILAAVIAAPVIASCGGDDSNNDTLQSGVSDSAAGSMSGTGGTATAAEQTMVGMIAMVDRAEIEAARLAVTKAQNADVKAFAQMLIDDHSNNLRQLTDLTTRSGWTMPDSNMMGSSSPGGSGTGGTTGGAASAASGTAGSGTAGTTGGATGSASGAGTATAASGAAGTAGAGSGATGAGTGATGAGTAGAVTGNSSSSGAMQPGTGELADLHSAHMNLMQQLQSASGAKFDRAFINGQVTMHQQALDRMRQRSGEVQNSDLRNHVNQTQTSVEAHLRRAQELQQRTGT